MSTEEENYFTLNNPSINNKPQPTTTSILQPEKSSLLNRRQKNAVLPIQSMGLPPLSDLLPTKNTVPMELIQPAMNSQLFMQDPNTAAAAAAAAAALAAPPNSTVIDPYNNYPSMLPTQPIMEPTTRQRQLSNASQSSSEKTYSFVTIPGVNQKKRPRRRYDEIERLYHCTWPGCSKAYGTLNHLNAHVSMQKHGPKRQPSEFREMRKEWRRQKKEREAMRKRQEEIMNQPFLNTTQFTNSLDPSMINGFY